MRIQHLYDKLDAEDHQAYRIWVRRALMLYGILILCGITAIVINTRAGQVESAQQAIQGVAPPS